MEGEERHRERGEGGAGRRGGGGDQGKVRRREGRAVREMLQCLEAESMDSVRWEGDKHRDVFPQGRGVPLVGHVHRITVACLCRVRASSRMRVCVLACAVCMCAQMRAAVKEAASLFPTAIISGRGREKVQPRALQLQLPFARCTSAEPVRAAVHVSHIVSRTQSFPCCFYDRRHT